MLYVALEVSNNSFQAPYFSLLNYFNFVSFGYFHDSKRASKPFSNSTLFLHSLKLHILKVEALHWSEM